MTLNTRVKVHKFFTGEVVFDYALKALLIAGGELHKLPNVLKEYSNSGDPLWEGGQLTHDYNTWWSTIGQGLPGIVEVEEHSDHFEVSWDTAYGYSCNGMGCSELHALALIELDRIMPWQIVAWNNEYSGEWHEVGPGGMMDQEDNIAEFLGSGDQAMDWFKNQVLPVFESLDKPGGV